MPSCGITWKYVKQIDPVNALTAGYAFSSQIEPTADLVDVLSFHDYSPTRVSVEAAYSTAEAVAKKFDKPILNTETGCIARSNPYDMVLEIANEHKTGWYLFNLMIRRLLGRDPRAVLSGRNNSRSRQRLQPSWGSTETAT